MIPINNLKGNYKAILFTVASNKVKCLAIIKGGESFVQWKIVAERKKT